MAYYTIVLLVYLGTDLLAIWGLNLEFGVAGIANLGYILLVAAGAYTYAVFTLGPDSSNGAFQTYIVGLHVAPAVAILIAVLVAAAIGAILGLTGLRRVRQDYQALVMLVAAILGVTLVGAAPHVLNGDQGLALIPRPIATQDGWDYVALVGGICVAAYLVLRRFTGGPLGRSLRAMRDDEAAAIAIGKNVVALRIMVQAVGGAFAGLSGALLVGFIGAWSPSAWQYLETLALLTAVIVGGTGNDAGVLLGTVLIPVLLLQGVQFLPDIPGHPGLTANLSIILFSALTIAFLFLRPRGIVPERKRRHRLKEPPDTVADAGSSSLHEAALARLIPLRAAAPRAARDVGEGAAPILVVERLARHFGGVHAVDEASFAVERGSITGLIGPNGAGKSTLLNIVAGSTSADVGVVRFDGTDVTRLSGFRRARRGLVRTFQLPHEFGRLTTIENLIVAAQRQRGESVAGVAIGRRYWRREEVTLVRRATDWLEAFGMEHQAERLASELSGGQKRMLEVMRALMTEPKLLLLDEPLAGLSPLLSERLGDVCSELRHKGVSILLVEHDLGAIERLCDHVVVMAQGRVLAQGAMSELRTSEEVQDAYLVG